MIKEFITNSEAETIELGKKVGELLDKNTLLCLKGDLAGGKTTFTKGIGLGLGISEVINSPTFTILKIYNGNIPLFHIDAYRLAENPYDLGFDELFNDDGVVVVEWFEYLSDILGTQYLQINFEHISEKERKITLTAFDEKYIKILENI